MSKLLLAATAAILLAGPVLAQAQEAAPAQAPLSTRGVDFSNPAQVKAFYNRLWRTAYTVCDSNSANPRIAQADLVCVKEAMAQAAQKIDAPRLTAMLDHRRAGDADVFQAAAH